MRIPLAVLLLAASAASAEVVVRPDLTLTDTDTHASAVTLPVGETLRIEFPAQPGTGYSWEPRPVDPPILDIVEAACDEIPATRRVGSIVQTCFAWIAVAPGRTTLSVVYRRHWETRPEGLLRYDLDVTVEPSG